jgi:hypothetical protein
MYVANRHERKKYMENTIKRGEKLTKNQRYIIRGFVLYNGVKDKADLTADQWIELLDNRLTVNFIKQVENAIFQTRFPNWKW